MRRYYLFITLFTLSCNGPRNASVSVDPFQTHDCFSNISYLIHQGKMEAAIDAIRMKRAQDPLLFHSGLFHEMAAACITSSLHGSTEDIMLALYAISIMHDDAMLHSMTPLLLSQEPLVQLACCRVLSTFDSDEAHQMLFRCMQSDFLPIRLEAAYELARRKHPKIVEQLEALYWKSENDVRPVIVSLFGEEGSSSAKDFLLGLLYYEDIEVRLSAIHAIAACEQNEDTFEQLATLDDPDPRLQEAICYALGNVSSIIGEGALKKYAGSHHEEVALAAAHALYRRGDRSASSIIEQLAKKNNRFAISLLTDIDSDTCLLKQKTESSEIDVSLNAAVALVGKQSEKALEVLLNLFISSPSDYLVTIQTSPGKSLQYLQMTPSKYAQTGYNRLLFDSDRQLKEKLLIRICEKEPSAFVQIACIIFATDQNDLVPITSKLLENMQTDDAMKLLQAGREKLGSPFIRTSCNIALFHITKEKKYRDQIREWVKKSDVNELLRVNPPLPIHALGTLIADRPTHSLTLEEKSMLLADSIEILAQAQDEEAVDQLLLVMRSGNSHNRSILAALLAQCSR